jgi:hypothetical protein
MLRAIAAGVCYQLFSGANLVTLGEGERTYTIGFGAYSKEFRKWFLKNLSRERIEMLRIEFGELFDQSKAREEEYAALYWASQTMVRSLPPSKRASAARFLEGIEEEPTERFVRQEWSWYSLYSFIRRYYPKNRTGELIQTARTQLRSDAKTNREVQREFGRFQELFEKLVRARTDFKRELFLDPFPSSP